uniref:ATP synthase complex subunit 8 n=1 Tax=Cavia aperea TaxID=37548 RepID=A0A0P0LEU9_CAVAP|nr:ATP synthase F0 subunit 8 [Cavia aperea]ALK60807.1 ATP synthase F0 subunit 8 [Cavia aperea]QIQ22950.1 ATP synthase F0 subunit 8 [Cavia aperea]
MPQLDTSTWFTVIMSMVISLFMLFQLKISSHSFYSDPKTMHLKTTKHSLPWENKWTKTYLPLSLPLH